MFGLGKFWDSVDFAFTDENTKEEFAEFRWRYPWAIYQDWWDYQAHVKSDGALPNPMNSQDWAYRRTAYGFVAKIPNKPGQQILKIQISYSEGLGN